VAARTVTVTGPRGTLVREFKGNSFAANLLGSRTLRVDMWFGTRLQLATLRTITTHIENMIQGVTKGYIYKMRFAYSHFPINVQLTKEGDAQAVEVRNFLGESRVRKVVMPAGVTVAKSANVKDEICLEGNDLELVSGSAARVHESCLVKNKDIRKFLDGLYVSERGPKGASISLM
jgi:large subunit ribosomal protein L9e